MVQPGDQRTLPGVKTHVRYAPLPERSFYRLGDEEIYVASPELCLLQLAVRLSEAQAAKLALEMCGKYAIDPLCDDPGMCKRPPLTAAAKLNAFAARMYTSNSRAHAVHFLRWVADNAASPRETALYLLLCMPPRFGGYGLAIPELNKRFKFNQKDRLLISADHFDCDLYWPNNRIAVEYDSALHHTAQEKQERDAIRRNMLEYKGITVITATRAQVSRESEFDKLARQIARAVGKRLRIPEKRHIAARSELRRTLFSWDVLPELAERYRIEAW